MTKTAFQCRMCGHCCLGKGGIVLGPKDMQRICAYLEMDEGTFMRTYGTLHNGKAKVRTGDDGACIFFEQHKGCTVHEGKPDICRAWPFFRGNMVDAVSLAMAKDFCPGIRADVTHAEFVEEGVLYLRDNQLIAHDPRHEALALISVDEEPGSINEPEAETPLANHP